MNVIVNRNLYQSKGDHKVFKHSTNVKYNSFLFCFSLCVCVFFFQFHQFLQTLHHLFLFICIKKNHKKKRDANNRTWIPGSKNTYHIVVHDLPINYQYPFPIIIALIECLYIWWLKFFFVFYCFILKNAEFHQMRLITFFWFYFPFFQM